MKRLILFLLGFFLPLHGGISIFLPDFFRYWKELFLCILILSVVIHLIQKQNFRAFFDEACAWKNSFFWALMFLLWGGGLILLSENLYWGALAFRGLGMFFLTYIFVYLFVFKKNLSQKKSCADTFFGLKKSNMDSLWQGLIYGTCIGVLFSTWVHFLGGDLIVKSFFSDTISSWVPGQKLPIWHETSGFTRFQGLASGPVSFAVFTLISILGCFRKKLFSRIFAKALILVLIFGLIMTFSRVAWVLLCCFLLYWSLPKTTIKKSLIIASSFLVMGIIFIFTVPIVRQTFTRVGTSQHFTNPLRVIQQTLSTPKKFIAGDLGNIGPIKRQKNMREKNSDKALIAENVLIDIFGQTGFIGFVIALLFFGTLAWKFFREKTQKQELFCLLFIFLNTATIFDMTPVAITSGGILVEDK